MWEQRRKTGELRILAVIGATLTLPLPLENGRHTKLIEATLRKIVFVCFLKIMKMNYNKVIITITFWVVLVLHNLVF